MDVILALITCGFISLIFNIIKTPFCTKFLWDNKYFKGRYVMAEIIYYDCVQLERWSYDVTIVNYVMNGKSIDALIEGKKGQRVGEKIHIITDGEVTFCTQKNWREFITGTYIIKIIICFLLGDFFVGHFKEINVNYIILSILINVILVLAYPIFYREFIKSLKSASGWHEKL